MVTSRRGCGQHVRATSHLRGLALPLPGATSRRSDRRGVLIVKAEQQDRLMIPVTDAGELSRIFVAAGDTIAKKDRIRVVGAGERVCALLATRSDEPARACRS